MNQTNYMEYRDLQYEQENIEYDEQYPEGGIKCKNYELCERVIGPDWWEYYGNYLCLNCGSWFKKGGFGWDELEFRQSNEECIVCNEISNTQVKFPTNCDHWFCISCSRNILFWDESRYHLSYEPFGCPPCPNECNNPIKGRQCDCEDYDEILEKWRQENPEQFKEYDDAENLSMESGETVGSIFSSGKCPLCRKEYKRMIYIK